MTEVIAAEQLRQYLSKIEKLLEDKKEVEEDIKEVYAEAKSNGFDIKIIKEVLRLKKMDKDDLAAKDTILDLYRQAIGI